MARIPPFSQLKQTFPHKPAGQTPHRSGAIPDGATIKGHKDLVAKIGGELYQRLSAIYRNLDEMNTCAVRLSLNRSAHK